MKEKHRGTIVFLISFGITILALGIILFAIAAVLNIKSGKASSSSTNYINSDAINERNNLSLVLIGSEEADSTPAFVLYVHFNAVSGKLLTFELPPTTYVELAGRKDTLIGHYDYKGPVGLSSALGSLFSTDTPLYLRMTRKNLANIANYLGGAVCTISKDTAEKYSIEQGTWRLDGDMISSLLLDTGVDAALKEKILLVLCGTELISELSDNFAGFLDILFENCVTNVSRYDLTIRRDAIEALVYAKSFSGESLLVEGSMTGKGFLLNEEMLSAIQKKLLA